MTKIKIFVENKGGILFFRDYWNIADISLHVRTTLSVGGQVFGEGSVFNIASPWMLPQIPAHKAYRASVIDLNGDDTHYISDGTRWVGLAPGVSEERADEHIKSLDIQFQEDPRTILNPDVDCYGSDKEVCYASSAKGDGCTVTIILNFPVEKWVVNKEAGEFGECGHMLMETPLESLDKASRKAKEKLCRLLPPDLSEKAKYLSSCTH